MIKKITIGNLDLVPENGYFIQKVASVGFEGKYSSSSVLEKHGAVLGSPYLLNKLINLELIVQGNNYEELFNRKNDLFSEIKYGKGSGKVKINFVLGNNENVFIDGVVKEVNEDYETGGINIQRLRISFETESAFFKSEQLYQVIIPITKGGGATVPMAVPLDMTQGSSGFSVVSVGGNADCYPEIYFYGPLTNPIFRNITTGENLSFNLSISSGSYVYVDTENRIVKDNLGFNRRADMDGDFIRLIVGENQFSLMSDVSSETGYVKLVFRNFYKGL